MGRRLHDRGGQLLHKVSASCELLLSPAVREVTVQFNAAADVNPPPGLITAGTVWIEMGVTGTNLLTHCSHYSCHSMICLWDVSCPHIVLQILWMLPPVCEVV